MRVGKVQWLVHVLPVLILSLLYFAQELTIWFLLW